MKYTHVHMHIDVVSDLHVETWSSIRPYDWHKHKTSDMVLIVGDISYTLAHTICELNRACDVYDHVLYIDGNHESIPYMNHDLDYAIARIETSMRVRSNFVSLYSQSFEVGDVVFVGANGWWDFEMTACGVSKEVATHRFMRKHPTVSNANIFIEKAHSQHACLKTRLERISKEKRVVMCTHTVPNAQCLSLMDLDGVPDVGHFGSSLLNEFASHPQVLGFVFGHIHNPGYWWIDGKFYLNHARGRNTKCEKSITYTPHILSIGEVGKRTSSEYDQ